MKILGIHDGHTATACYFEDGEIRAAVSEERLTKVKGAGGFPSRTLHHFIEKFGLDIASLDKVALVGKVAPLISINQYNQGRQKFFPKLIRYLPINPRLLISAYVGIKERKRLLNPSLLSSLSSFNIPVDKVSVIEHHQTHAATAYYLSPFYQRKEKSLVITLDGSGDGLCGTVSIVDEQGVWKRLRGFSSFDSLGMIYSRATQHLAMRPWEHEYKLMGMAPYAEEKYAKRALEVFKKYITLTDDGLGLHNPTRLWGNSLLDALHEELRYHRFDAVSAGVQLLHEEITLGLVRNWIKKTGVSNLAVAGGCFMNIKANKLILEMPEVSELFVMPSCGDESCAIGAALQAYADLNKNFDAAIRPLKDLYWGGDFSAHEIEQYLNTQSALIEFRKSDDIERESAELLAQHKMIGRVSGRMEWGARALGNRSIVSNPSRSDNLRKLNSAIKMRDFWMPFAPSILWEDRYEYAQYHKETEVFHMTLGFDSTQKAKEHIIAALHPYDLTMRPQFVRQDYNPRYHKLISNFKDLTGIGGVLNTSFNLHGMPIVNGPDDAIYTLLNSDLDYVTLDDYLVWKKR